MSRFSFWLSAIGASVTLLRLSFLGDKAPIGGFMVGLSLGVVLGVSASWKRNEP